MTLSGSGEPDCPYVSRGGLKLLHALDRFGLDVTGMRCADLGASTGGFTDCLLQAGAASVYSVDTAYGEFAWKLRNDERVRVIERTNALHAELPDDLGTGVDLVVIDLGWTRQERAIPAALRWLGPDGRIVSLIKPHYETPRARVKHGEKVEPLDDATAERVAREVAARMQGLGVRVLDMVPSPIRGGKTGKGTAKGNVEFLILLTRAETGGF